MFSRIAMLVLQEQVRPRRAARKWRRKTKTAKNNTAVTHEPTLKRGRSEIKLKKQNSQRWLKTTEPILEASHVEKERITKDSNDLFEEIMAEIKKYAKAGKKPPPESIPSAICFDLGGSKASHADVYYQLRELLLLKGDCQIKSLQYLAICFRWKIVLDSQASRDRIAGSEININGKKVLLRRYDDIMALEYRKYLRANGFIDTIMNSHLK